MLSYEQRSGEQTSLNRVYLLSSISSHSIHHHSVNTYAIAIVILLNLCLTLVSVSSKTSLSPSSWTEYKLWYNYGISVFWHVRLQTYTRFSDVCSPDRCSPSQWQWHMCLLNDGEWNVTKLKVKCKHTQRLVDQLQMSFMSSFWIWSDGRGKVSPFSDDVLSKWRE